MARQTAPTGSYMTVTFTPWVHDVNDTGWGEDAGWWILAQHIDSEHVPGEQFRAELRGCICPGVTGKEKRKCSKWHRANVERFAKKVATGEVRFATTEPGSPDLRLWHEWEIGTR